MDKKARQVMDELRALKQKAQELAEQQKELGDKIQRVIEHHQHWLEDAAERNGSGGAA